VRVSAGTKAILGASLLATSLLAAPQAGAGPQTCNDAFCTPGIMPYRVLGAPCDNTTYYVFGTAVAGPSIEPGRLLFCGSPRRYEPRWFRSPEMHGIRNLDESCIGELSSAAQAPDGLFLMCVSVDGKSTWQRGDL